MLPPICTGIPPYIMAPAGYPCCGYTPCGGEYAMAYGIMAWPFAMNMGAAAQVQAVRGLAVL